MEDRFYYRISSLMPSENIPHSNYNFSAEIDPSLAEKAFKNSPKEGFIKNFQEGGKKLISKYFDLKIENLLGPYNFIEKQDGKESFLLRGICVPGDACDLSIDGTEYGRIIEKPDQIKHLYHLQYVPHNVDNHTQAFALLALWTEWANFLNIFKED